MGEDSASIIRKLFDAFSAKDYDAIEALVTDDFELIVCATGEKFNGPEGARRNAEGWLIPSRPRAPPEFHFVAALGDF